MPDKFWNTKQGKILSHGIHEHSSGLGLIVNNLSILKRYLEMEDLKNKEEIDKCIESMMNAKTKCKDSIDFIYTETKKLTQNESN